MRKLWFNQTGDADFDYGLFEEEETPDVGLGDTLDKFDDNPRVDYTHSFDKEMLPEELQWNEQGEHCEFIYTERENIQSEMNFATTQEEIDNLYKRLDTLYDLSDQEGCF